MTDNNDTCTFIIYRVLPDGETEYVDTIKSDYSSDALLEALDIDSDTFYSEWKVCEMHDAEYIVGHHPKDDFDCKYFYRKKHQKIY